MTDRLIKNAIQAWLDNVPAIFMGDSADKTELLKLDRDALMSELIAYTNRRDPVVVLRVLRLIIELDPSKISLVHDFVGHPQFFVRRTAIDLMDIVGDHSSISILEIALRNDPDSELRLEAARVLASYGNSGSRDLLEWKAQFDRGMDFEGRRVSDAVKSALKKYF
jgi:hypothetical protein